MPTVTAQYVQKKIFRIVSEVARERGVRAFAIGGFVRDCFGRPCNDIDIVVEGSGIDFAQAVGEKTGKSVSYFKNFGTAMLHFEGDEIEFVGARKESYRRESRNPIVENGTLEDDQLRRDQGPCRRHHPHTAGSGHNLLRRSPAHAAGRTIRHQTQHSRASLHHSSRIHRIHEADGPENGDSIERKDCGGA